jgi:hypothetical protein
LDLLAQSSLKSIELLLSRFSSRVAFLKLEVLGYKTIALCQLDETVVGLTHSADIAADSISPVLSGHSSGSRVDLSKIDLDRGAILCPDDSVAGRAFPRDIHIHVFSRFVLHVDELMRRRSNCLDAGDRWTQKRLIHVELVTIVNYCITHFINLI